MKKKLIIVLTAAILALYILTGCSSQAQTIRVEPIELDLETLEAAEDTKTQDKASDADAQSQDKASDADAQSQTMTTAVISNAEETSAGQEEAAETEAAVMGENMPSIPEDQTVTVRTSTQAVTGTFHYAEAYKVLDLVNEHRESLGLNALTWDEDMREAAEIRAAEATLSWSHTRPNGESWYTVSDLVKGENLAKGYDSAEDVFAAWMASPGHRENIEWEQATTICVAYFEISSGGYWAMELGYKDH